MITFPDHCSRKTLCEIMMGNVSAAPQSKVCLDINCPLFDCNTELIDKFKHEFVSHPLLMRRWRLLLPPTRNSGSASDAVRRLSSSGVFTSKADVCNVVTFPRASVSLGWGGGRGGPQTTAPIICTASLLMLC